MDVMAREFELGDVNAPPSTATRWLLPRVIDPRIPERRRENYRFLLDRLRHLVPDAFSSLPDGACPFAFPIESDGSDALVGRLETHGLKALLLWKYPHPSLCVEDFPAAKRLRDTVIALPVHQGLTSADLHRMVDVVLETIGAGSGE